MNFETFGKSLRLAVDEAFTLEAAQEKTLQESIRSLHKLEQEAHLERISSEQQPGLRQKLAEAYCSGDEALICVRSQQARVQAINSVIRTSARIALNTPNRSTIWRKRGRY